MDKKLEELQKEKEDGVRENNEQWEKKLEEALQEKVCFPVLPYSIN